MCVESNVAAFGLGYGKEVSANASEIDDLCGRSAGIAGGHLLRGVIEDAKANGQSYENANELAHEASLNPGTARGKTAEPRECQRVLGRAKEAE